ncbi:Zn-dependent hydrolase [Reinekea marinisedimentorum]|uniref:N-carbamoyl-L-amino-acid hydrolase n=1 Tax=Reinekea marinisedimentorum TaxID=230495 RepID=A0A4R3HUG5_9GAMM|nr:Zn-dependent hydrolase [Reinekea marinisedimentorum]TCS36688.1 N-carbamoyl-L-amino-acid hydrolase [Reinekea marinisedimentorum]
MNPTYPNKQRFWDWTMALAEISEPGVPYTRRSFSPLFMEGRRWLEQQMQALGLTTSVDAAGNLIGRLEGTDPNAKTIMIGSHSDTVPSGGRFDGIAGVIAGLECIASWKDAGKQLRHSVEIVDYLAEEPSEWGISCVGSRGITGFLTPELLATEHPDTKELLSSALKRVGGDGEQLYKREDVAAAFELHIEQGTVLETERLDVGIVSGIVGILRLNILFEGAAGHAGTTPMDIRRDASVAAARTNYLASEAATRIWKDSGYYLTATCGQTFIHPNASNVVPGKAELVFDIRSDDKATMEAFASELKRIAEESAELANVEVTEFQRMTDTYPVRADTQLMANIRSACDTHNIKAREMPSGAGHDAAFLAHIAPMAMVFVPSKEGVSHRPDEWTTAEQFEKGIAALITAVESFDQLN